MGSSGEAGLVGDYPAAELLALRVIRRIAHTGHPTRFGNMSSTSEMKLDLTQRLHSILAGMSRSGNPNLRKR